MSPVETYGPFVWLVIAVRISEHTVTTQVDSVWTHNFLAQRRMVDLKETEAHVLVHCEKHLISGGSTAVRDYAKDALRRAQ